jgi:hypothetical protein
VYPEQSMIAWWTVELAAMIFLIVWWPVELARNMDVNKELRNLPRNAMSTAVSSMNSVSF